MALKIRPRAVALCALPALCVGAAMADDTPYYLGVSQSLVHDSNVYRLGSGQPTTSDTISTTRLVAGVDQPVGRLRFTGDAAIGATRYANTSALDYNPYSLDIGMDWATIERLSGTVRLSGYRTLARFDPGSGVPTTLRNVEKSHTASATARLGLVTRLSFDVGISRRQLGYSLDNAVVDSREYSQDVYSGGLRYRFSGALTSTVALRHTKTVYPRYSTTGLGANVEDRARRNDLDFTTTWVPTGASTINGRLSWTNSQHTADGARDYGGLTGIASWDWRPGGRLTLSTALSRDLEDTTIPGSTTTPSPNDFSRSTVGTRLRVRAEYALTGKIALNSELAYRHRSLADPGFTPPTGSDNTVTWSFGAGWNPVRTVQLGCNVTGENRNSSNNALSLGYSATSFGCSGRWIID